MKLILDEMNSIRVMSNLEPSVSEEQQALRCFPSIQRNEEGQLNQLTNNEWQGAYSSQMKLTDSLGQGQEVSLIYW